MIYVLKKFKFSNINIVLFSVTYIQIKKLYKKVDRFFLYIIITNSDLHVDIKLMENNIGKINFQNIILNFSSSTNLLRDLSFSYFQLSSAFEVHFVLKHYNAANCFT